MATTATIRDVAKRAGVGVGTVSRVLNDSRSVREATRRKVLDAIEDLDYRPSPVARRLSSGKAMAVGVIVPFFTNASVVKRLQGIVSVLAASDYDLVLFDVENTENRDALLHNIVQRKIVDGLVIVSMQPTDSDMERFLEARIPAVIVDATHPELPCIIVDNVEGGRLATQHLISLGHKKIGYISDYPDSPFNFSPVHDRYEGYRTALEGAGISCQAAYYREGELSSRAARQLAHELLDLFQPPTAIFAYSDTQAVGVLEAARERGVQVPGDLSVIGYDDIDIAEYAQLSTVRQSLFESGVVGAEMMLELIEDPDKELDDVLLPVQLVVRCTTAEPTCKDPG